MQLIQKSMLFFITILAAYELMGYLLINKDAAFMILFGPFKIAYFVGYIFLVFIVPFLFIVKSTKPVYTVIASLCVIVGGYVGRFLFVYGGNANPLTNRFGTGFEKYNLYDVAKSYNFVTPHFGEISIVVGSVGVAILVYKIFDILFSVNDIREH